MQFYLIYLILSRNRNFGTGGDFVSRVLLNLQKSITYQNVGNKASSLSVCLSCSSEKYFATNFDSFVLGSSGVPLFITLGTVYANYVRNFDWRIFFIIK